MSQCFPMNSGDDTISYANNSTAQRDSASAMMGVIKKAMLENLDVEKLLSSSSSSSSTFVIADLGCSTGPNTFYAIQTLIEAVQHKYICKYNQESSKNLEFQVFFNDQVGNDFNTLFASLPEPRNYMAAAVPGSFHGRLFPSNSIHLAYSSFAVHCLSKVPDEVLVKDSSAYNEGRILYTGASDAVVKAYEDQFEQDFDNFLKARSQEIATGGLILILMLGTPRRDVQHLATKLYTFIGSLLMDMVKEGVVEKEKVDSFNIPLIISCIDDIRKVGEKNGCFEIVKLEALDDVLPKVDSESGILHFRAVSDAMIIDHFGNTVRNQLWERAMQRKLEYDPSDSAGYFGGLLFLALKRKSL